MQGEEQGTFCIWLCLKSANVFWSWSKSWKEVWMHVIVIREIMIARGNETWGVHKACRAERWGAEAVAEQCYTMLHASQLLAADASFLTLPHFHRLMWSSKSG